MRYMLFTLARLLYLLVWLMEMISYISVLLITAMNHISVSFQMHHLKSQGSRYHSGHLEAYSEYEFGSVYWNVLLADLRFIQAHFVHMLN